MKRIISLIIALAMMLSVACVSVYATDSAVGASYELSTRKITLEGTFPENHGPIAVLISRYVAGTLESYNQLTEANVGDYLVHMTIWDGAENLVITMPESITAGWYIAFCSIQGVGAVPSEKFYITNTTEQNAAINAFKTATASTIGNAITTYAVEKAVIDLNLDSAVWAANAQDVQKIFVNCIAEEKERLAQTPEDDDLTLDSISVCFDKALAITDFNSAVDKGATLGGYKTLLGLSATADSNSNFEAAAGLILSQTEAVDNKIWSQSDLNTAFDKGVAICVVNSSTRDTVRGNLKAYEGIIGIDVDAGYASADETKLNAAMAYGTHTTTELIKGAFETAVLQNPKPTTPVGGATLGGNGNTGGGITGGGNGNQVVVRPSVSDKEDKTPMETEGVFADIAAYKWAEDAITYLNKAGVLQGVGNGKFEPARNIKREEIAKILVEAFDLSDKGQAADFTDVSKDAWHYNYVNTAYQNGIINGIGGENFGTGSFVTREDAAVMIYRYLKSTGYEFLSDGADFNDIDDCADYAKEAIKAMKNSGLIAGNGDNTFCPKDSLTRAQAAVMIYNIISEMEAK